MDNATPCQQCQECKGCKLVTMFSTTTPFGQEFYKSLIDQLFQAVDNGTKMAAHMLWDALINFLVHDWLLVLGILTFFLVIAIIEFLTTGRWAMLGSVLYHYIYYGILFLIGLIFGPEIFTNDWADLLFFVVYAISFTWVGIILSKTGIRGRW